MVTFCSSSIFWKVPASWSAWQWVRMMLSISLGLTLESTSHSVELTGGSTMIPLWFSQMMKPEVFSSGSKPWLGPRQVTPKRGGLYGSGSRLPIRYFGLYSTLRRAPSAITPSPPAHAESCRSP